MKDVKYVVTYEKRKSIRKITFSNGVQLDLFPDFQNLLYEHRQINEDLPEAGGILIGYENAETGNITIAKGTAPKSLDFRSRARLSLSKQHRSEIQELEYPYGYMGTWHTHPTDVPIPSSVDLQDWKKCLKKNKYATDSLIFIIGGKEAFRIWRYDSATEQLIEGKEK